MTARPLRATRAATGLRVIQGRQIRRPLVTPWLAFIVIVVAALLGIVVARTTLDQGAFQRADLDRQIAEAETANQSLRLEVARLESPARIGPLAIELGMVYPTERRTVMVAGVAEEPDDADPRWASVDRFAAEVTP